MGALRDCDECVQPTHRGEVNLYRNASDIVVDALAIARLRRRPELGTEFDLNEGPQPAHQLIFRALTSPRRIARIHGADAPNVNNAHRESLDRLSNATSLGCTACDSKARLVSAMFEWTEDLSDFRRRHSVLDYLRPRQLRSPSRQRRIAA